MKKKASDRRKVAAPPPGLFARPKSRRLRSLILPRHLAYSAEDKTLQGKPQDRAYEVLKRWADLDAQGHLHKKETALDADFLREVFGDALGYRTATQSPEKYQQQRNFTVPGVGTADGALGDFSPTSAAAVAVIELKGAAADLDRDRFNGRTPVQQCWDYLNALPDCPWGIVSNFVTFRLYHRDKTPLACEEFQLQELRKIEVFRRFYCLFEVGGLLRSGLKRPPRALALLRQTEDRRREVGDELYQAFSDNRARLIDHLRLKHGKAPAVALHIAQKLLDRIIFVAFCEQRGLLRENCIEASYLSVPPFSKVTNPRWQNFLGLFSAIDKDYNGGLFQTDPEVDDLQLDDDWTNFFHTIAKYDFRDEVNVDVLGHIFEKSVGELEQLRVALIAADAAGEGEPAVVSAMPKSAERKRFGIYYTPPDFTRFIVEQTVTAVVQQRKEAVRLAQHLTPEDVEANEPSASLAAYWRDCWEAVRGVKVCDPACGSGAFLIQAYEILEEQYGDMADRLRAQGDVSADALQESIPDVILADNLYGVDLSEQAVEITRLALWIRSARQGKTLADLTHNVVCGNSLVEDAAVHEKAMNWQAVFRDVFGRAEGGFDCVIGNPPWERLKLQEREFFALSAPTIAGAVSAAKRREMVAALERGNPTLFAAYKKAKDAADRILSYVRKAGHYPLTGQGDVNTYILFAELARKLVAPRGRVGLLTPSGVATDDTTKEFFAALMESKALVGLYDFENRLRIFPDVDGRFKFCVLLFGGAEADTRQADFVFFAHKMADLNDRNRHVPLSGKDLALLNPNTRTCPIFRSHKDAELTKALYRRVPILLDTSREEGGNPWGLKFHTMFHQTNDAELFHSPEQLQELGCRLEGNRWVGAGRTFLPLYEAKMIQAYDHRAASVVVAAGNWVRQGQTEATSPVEHQNPAFVAQPRWWVGEGEVASACGGAVRPAYLSYKDVTSATNERTMIAALIPHVAVVNSAPLMLTGDKISARLTCCLLGNLNSLALDFVARQKVGGNHLNYFIVNQLPVFPPDAYARPCPWDRRRTLETWISERVLKLTCTANDMKPLAEAADFDPPVHKWNDGERGELLAELDAAYFLLYGVGREDMGYIFDTFSGFRVDGEALPGMASPRRLVQAAYDRLSERIAKAAP